MSKPRVTFSSFAALVLCSTFASAQPPHRAAASQDPDLKELSTYTLTTDILAKVDRVNRAVVASIQKDPKYAERIKLGKELAELKKKDEPTEAEQKRIEDLEARIEQFDESNKAADTSGDANSIAGMERALTAVPGMSAALKQEGMAAREYAKFSLAMIQASFALGAKQMTEKMGKPFQMPEGVNPANVKFVQEHEADLKKMQDAYAQLNGMK